MKRILITGGAGFIGSHLCRQLLKDGHDVICLDNLYSSSKANISDLLSQPRFEFIRHDVTIPFHFEVDEIYHLACPASPVHYQSNPIKTIKTTILGTTNVLDLAYSLKCRILSASTSEVYGDPTVHPQREDYWGNVNPIGVRSCYDEGKRCAETLCLDYFRQYRFPIKVVRIFNTYGPYMQPNDGRVVSNFIVQALKGEDLTIYGDGKQTRSFCFIDDLIQGILKMMDTEDSFIGPANLGNPAELMVSELAEKIIALTGTKSNIVHKPLPHDDPKQRQPDITRAKEKLSWEPKVDIETGLKETISYFRRILQL